MLKATPLKAAGLAVLAAAAFTIAAPAAGAEDRLVKIDGSSTVYPITEGVAEEFQKMKRGAVKVTVGVSGTGGGFKKFCRGETDISDASRPILKKTPCRTASPAWSWGTKCWTPCRCTRWPGAPTACSSAAWQTREMALSGVSAR